ncbi:monooxygenase [Coemansia sp. RSA 2599]|nr:monooxygenase [Coemansia sp. RSA 2598]KAJ1807119.1 monooxygenase [Coemansia sp. RSA 2599]
MSGLFAYYRCYSPESKCHYNVPQESCQTALRHNYDERSPTTGGYPTPLYDELHTNLPKDVMQFPGFPFPPDTPEFPDRKQVQDYVRSYADTHGLRKVIKLNTQVLSISYVNNQWQCVSRDLVHKRTNTEYFDAMLVCTGRVSHPYIPDIPGLQELKQNRPEGMISAKEFRKASEYSGKTVMVVGGAFSAYDIARQLSYTVGQLHVSLPHRDDDDNKESPSFDGFDQNNLPAIHPVIKKVDLQTVYFADGSQMPMPDTIIFATGYLYSYPFIDNTNPLTLVCSQVDPLQNLRCFTDGHNINDLYEYLVYIYNPSLAVFGVPFNVAPFPLYEHQAHFLAHLYKGEVKLPGFDEMKTMWEDLVKQRPGKLLFKMGLEQIPYRNSLMDIVEKYVRDTCPTSKRLEYVTEDSEWAKRLKKPELHLQALGYGIKF